MGQRANLVLVRDGAWSLRYTHWRANLLDRDLFWGPDVATAFVLAQQQREADQWLDDVWAEGGAVIDHDARVLLWFGGEHTLYDVPFRATHLGLMRRLWPGWDVRWADDGIVDVAAHVGVPAERVLLPYVDEDDGDLRRSLATSGDDDDDDASADVVGAVRSPAGEWRLFPLGGWYGVESLLHLGHALLDALSRRLGHGRFELAAGAEFPRGGFSIDEAARRVDYWCASAMPSVRRRVRDRWPGWNVRWHRDDYAAWAAPLGDAFRFPLVDGAALRTRVRDALLAPAGQDGVQFMLDVIARLGGEHDVQANPNALRDARVELTAERKRELLDAVDPGA